MGSIFHLDSPLMKALSVTADLLVLNFIAGLCALPLITAGASLTALHDVLLQIVRNRESYLVRSFFRSFRSNIRKGSCLGCLFLVLFFILYLEQRFVSANLGLPAFLTGFIAAAAAILLAIAIYSFGLLSHFENTVGNTLKNAVLLAIAYFPRTLGMLVFTIGFWLLILRFPARLFPLGLLFGIALPAYVSTLLYEPVFRKLDGEEEEGGEAV